MIVRVRDAHDQATLDASVLVGLEGELDAGDDPAADELLGAEVLVR